MINDAILREALTRTNELMEADEARGGDDKVLELASIDVEELIEFCAQSAIGATLARLEVATPPLMHTQINLMYGVLVGIIAARLDGAETHKGEVR